LGSTINGKPFKTQFVLASDNTLPWAQTEQVMFESYTKQLVIWLGTAWQAPELLTKNPLLQTEQTGGVTVSLIDAQFGTFAETQLVTPFETTFVEPGGHAAQALAEV
jgi:hypothetical protein